VVETIEQLANELRTDIDWEVRREAARKLAAYKDPKAVEALVDALDDLDDEVQQYAIKALARIGDPHSAEALLKPRVYRSENPITRWFTVAALGRLGEPVVVEALADALADEEWIVRNEAAEALKSLVAQIAHNETADTVRRLLRLLVVENAEVRELVISILCRLQAVSVIPLVEALELHSPSLRAGICEVLGRIGNVEVAPAVIEVIDDESALVREHAIRCLGKLGDPGSIDAIAERLGDHDSRVVGAAVEVLAASGAGATSLLLNRLKHSRSRQTRANILAVLGKGKDPAALIPLIGYLSDSFFRVRRAAADALIAHGEAAIAAVAELLSLPKVAVQPVVRCATEETNKRMRLRAIRSLGELKNAKTVEALQQLAGDADEVVAATAEAALVKVNGATWARYYASYVLGRISSPQGLKPLFAVLGDPSPIVRYGAVRALGRISGRKVAGPLALVLVSDGDEDVRAEAAKALAQVEIEDPVFISMLLKGLEDPSPIVRVPVARLLGRLEDVRVVQPLIGALEDPHWKVRRNAQNALVSLGSDAVPQLLEALTGAGTDARLALIETLGDIGDPQAEAPLEALQAEASGSPEIQAAILTAIQTITGEHSDAD